MSRTSDRCDLVKLLLVLAMFPLVAWLLGYYWPEVTEFLTAHRWVAPAIVLTCMSAICLLILGTALRRREP